jgi:F-type H+-transporting ATPase subunit epsilon
MRLAIATPAEDLSIVGVTEIILEGPLGSFCFLPRHIDFISALVPGIMEYRTVEGDDRWIAVDEGLVVKRGDEVTVATRAFVAGDALGDLEKTVRERFERLDEEERETRATLARLEVDFMRRFEKPR